jgi:hypothetical protein
LLRLLFLRIGAVPARAGKRPGLLPLTAAGATGSFADRSAITNSQTSRSASWLVFMFAHISRAVRKGDVICTECSAGFRRIELGSRRGTVGEFRCPLCNHLLEAFDGSTEIACRLTVAPEKIFE